MFDWGRVSEGLGNNGYNMGNLMKETIVASLRPTQTLKFVVLSGMVWYFPMRQPEIQASVLWQSLAAVKLNSGS